MAKRKVDGKNKSGDTASSEKGKKKRYSEDSHAKDEDALKGNFTKSKRASVIEDKKAKSNLADEGSGLTRRYSTRRGRTVDEKAKGETSGEKNMGKNDATRKRKQSEMVKTPAKRRKVDQQKAEISVSSNEKSSYSFREKRAITCFRKVDLSESEFEGVVGKRVKVFRSESRRWCTGRIESYNRKKKQHKVVYNDDKEGDLDMKTQRFELEVKHSEAYNFKEGSSAGKGKSVSVEDDEIKENTSSVSKGRFSRAQKGKQIATETNKVEKDKGRDSGPVEKIIKLAEPIVTRDAKKRGSKSGKKGSATDEKKEHVASQKTISDAGSVAKIVSRKTKKAGDETKVESRRIPVRKARANVRTRS